MCALVLLDGVILCAMGVQGAYTQRIYDEVKGRPLYIIKERQKLSLFKSNARGR